jgi:hypothetical protein
MKISIFLFLFVTLAACVSSATDQPVESPGPTTNIPLLPTDTQVPPTNTATITETSTPTATATNTQTKTPTLTFTPVPTSTPSQTPTESIQVGNTPGLIVKYLVLQGTGGSIGCGDSLVPVSADFLRTGDVKEDVKIALTRLFSTGTKYVGDLYNPLFPSNLSVSDVSFNKKTGNVTVHLTGSFTKPKEDCDKLLYRAEVWATARQFPEVKLATIWLNKYLLGDLLVVGDN